MRWEANAESPWCVASAAKGSYTATVTAAASAGGTSHRGSAATTAISATGITAAVDDVLAFTDDDWLGMVGCRDMSISGPTFPSAGNTGSWP